MSETTHRETLKWLRADAKAKLDLNGYSVEHYTAVVNATTAALAALDRPEPIKPLSIDRSQPIRRDVARLLDNLYGLHCRPGHIDAVLEVFQLHTPVKVPLDRDGQTCEWTPDDDGIYQTTCGHEFVFIDDGPVENKQQFCCYCGKTLKAEPVRQPRVSD